MRSQAWGKRRGPRTRRWDLETELGQCGSGQVEEVHRLRDVDEGVRVVFEAEFFPLVVEVRLDEKVRTQGRWFAGISPPAAKAHLPLGPAAVGDGGDLAGQLHAGVGRDAAVSFLGRLIDWNVRLCKLKSSSRKDAPISE